MKKGETYFDPTRSGLVFEKHTDLRALLANLPDVTVRGDSIFIRDEERGLLCGKNKFYSVFLSPRGVDHRRLVHAKLLPDEALVALDRKVVTILEKKFQEVQGSVDEKLATCDFKIKQYQKLVGPLGFSVQFAYVLCDWFRNKRYEDYLEYISTVNCRYFFREVPFGFFKLEGEVDEP